jgi:hypothetical protein
VAASSDEISRIGRPAESEEAMRRVLQWSALPLIYLFGTQHGLVQPVQCGGDNVCIVEAQADEQPVESTAVAKAVKLAAPERCLGVPVDVTSASPDESALACSAANDAIHLLGRCGISLRRPLHVQIMTEVRHPFGGAIFGLFDTKRERVLVTQEASIPALVDGTPYAVLPRRDFYRSLIVHEVVHGVMHQNLKRPPTSHAAYEYPAYALQIESLTANVRSTFLQSFDQLAIKSNSIFNDSILLFDPYFFAAHAYHHFKTSANGCAHLTALLEGEVDFIAPSQM